jgi:steroid delta-isomerase-like uncharacterized protein
MNRQITEEETNGIVNVLVDALNNHDLDVLAGLCAPDYEGIDVNQAAPQHGRNEVRQSLEAYLRAFPDFRVVEHEAVVEGNRAAFVWKACGTHLGTIMHIPPTGKRVVVRGTSMLHFEKGRVRRAVHIWDVAAMLREIGLLPEL